MDPDDELDFISAPAKEGSIHQRLELNQQKTTIEEYKERGERGAWVAEEEARGDHST